MAKNAVILKSTGSVIKMGYQDFTQPGNGYDSNLHAQYALDPLGEIPPDGVLLKYVKVGVIATAPVPPYMLQEMTVPEKAVVDANTPTDVVQRKIVPGETTVNTGGSDATTGFASVVGGQVTCKPLKAGDYQLLVSFELALTAAGIWAAAGVDRGAQARLLLNGTEIATWLNPLNFYHCNVFVGGDTFTEGAVLVLDLQIRRFGALGSAKARRIRMELSPAQSGVSA